MMGRKRAIKTGQATKEQSSTRKKKKKRKKVEQKVFLKEGIFDKVILGIDPGGDNCGFGVIASDGNVIGYVESGTWVISRKRYEGGGMQVLRVAVAFNKLLKNLIAEYKNVFVVFEEIRFHGEGNPIDAAHLYGEITGQIMAICEANEIPYTGINPKSARKLAIRDGKADKPKVRRRLEELFDIKMNSIDRKMKSGKDKGKIKRFFDESDALCVAVALAELFDFVGGYVELESNIG